MDAAKTTIHGGTAHAIHCSCWPSSPRARRQRHTRDAAASSNASASPICAAASVIGRNGVAICRPKGFCSDGAMRRTPGRTARLMSCSNPDVIANHTTMRHCADSSRPPGNSNNMTAISAALTFSGYARAATIRARSGVRERAYAAKFCANRSNEDTTSATRTIHPIGFFGSRLAISSPIIAIKLNVSTANSRIPGPPVAASVPSRTGKSLATHSTTLEPSTPSVNRHNDQASPATARAFKIRTSRRGHCAPSGGNCKALPARNVRHSGPPRSRRLGLRPLTCQSTPPGTCE